MIWHSIFLFLWLISLSMIPSKYIHVLTNGKFLCFLWLSSIPVCVCVCVSVRVCVYHIFLIHLSTDGHLDSFCVLTTINNATMNTGCMYLFELVFFQIYTQDWNCGVIWYFLFLVRSTVFHNDCTNLHSHQPHIGRFPFLHFLTNVCYFFFFFYGSHSNRYEVFSAKSLWGFSFPWWLMMLNILSCACYLSVCFGKTCVQIFCLFLNQIVFFF